MNPAGWYDDPGDPAQVRWWDGTAWTVETRPKPVPQQGAAGGATPPQKATKPFYRRTWVLVTAGIVVLIFAIGALGSSGADRSDPVAAAPEEAVAQTPTVDAAAEAEASAQAAEDQAAEEARVAEEAAAAQAAADAAAAAQAAQGTVSQQNAYRAAQSYLELTSFSRAGLIQQLTSEYGEAYPAEDAEFAVARLESEGGVDWNAEAAEAAQSYLELTSFSRQGLIDQLTSEYGDGFTQEQAEYGVSTTGL